MKIHWVYYGPGCYQCLYAAARKGFWGIFFFFFSPLCSSWECDSLKWWINQTFWWLVFFCEYKAPGQVLFDYFVVMFGGVVGWLLGCVVIDCTPRMLIMAGGGSQGICVQGVFTKSKISFEMRDTGRYQRWEIKGVIVTENHLAAGIN